MLLVGSWVHSWCYGCRFENQIEETADLTTRATQATTIRLNGNNTHARTLFPESGIVAIRSSPIAAETIDDKRVARIALNHVLDNGAYTRAIITDTMANTESATLRA